MKPQKVVIIHSNRETAPEYFPPDHDDSIDTYPDGDDIAKLREEFKKNDRLGWREKKGIVPGPLKKIA
jgi:hypothetical protein